MLQNLKSPTTRLYLIVPDIEHMIKILRSLWQKDSMSEGIHIVIKDSSQFGMKQLLEAGILKTTDLAGALIRGGLIGVILGVLSSFLLMKFPFEGLNIGIGGAVGLTVFAAMFGMWSSSLIGVSVANPMMEKCKRAMEAGGLVILVDLPKNKEKELVDFIKSYYPETALYGIELPTEAAISRA